MGMLIHRHRKEEVKQEQVEKLAPVISEEVPKETKKKATKK